MSEKEPINAMYGTKMSLNLDKIKKDDKEDVVEEKPVEEVQEVVEEPVVEESAEEVAEEAPVEEPEEVQEVVEEPADDVEEAPVEEPEEVQEVEEEAPEDVEEPAEEAPAEDEPSNDDVTLDKVVAKLKKEIVEKTEKLSNQSSELNYLTNKIIPKLKKENSELKSVKMELTDALEKSTRKYFNQLDISADLSNKIGKIGAESAVNKVRADKLESEIDNIKQSYESKISDLKAKLDSFDVSEVDNLKNENQQLRDELKDTNQELDKSKEENKKLNNEVMDLRNDLIEIGDYKEEVDLKNKQTINQYKEENSSLKSQLKIKESSYDKLANDTNRTISDLRKQVAKLEEALEKESNKGLFNRFK